MAEKQIQSESTEDEFIYSNDLCTDQPKEYFHLPDGIHQAHNLGRKQVLHRGMEIVQNSLNVQRSNNEAIIFLYGLNGAGKSTSLNHLFGFKLIDISGEKTNCTKLVTEYVATMVAHELDVTNLKIGFIDMPGWSDEGGEEKDILNIATIDQFINNHPFLGSTFNRCYPNIVMVAVNANDRRIAGANSQLVRMFRALNKLRVIDKSRPNLLIVLTHVMNLGRKRFLDKLNEIIALVKELVICFLGVEPVIVYIENEFEEYELEVRGDWSVLYDGTLQPKNVFQAMMELTAEHGNEMGHEAIRLYFASRGTNKPVIKQQSMPETLSKYDIIKWRSIITQEFANAPRNELNQVLQTYAQEQSGIYSERSLVCLMIELNAHSLTRLDTILSMTLNQVQDVLLPYILSPIEIQALVEGCGVTGYELQEVIHNIGYGVNAETGVVSRTPVLNQASNYHVQGGVNLPVSMHAVIPTHKRRIEWDRFDEAVSSPDFCHKETTGGSILVKYQFKIVHSIYAIKMILSNHQQLFSQLSPAFKEAVIALPERSIGEENQLRGEYLDFLRTFGHGVIVGCECGGSLQGVVEMEEREAEQSLIDNNMYIQSFLDKLESEDLANTTFQNIIDEGGHICKQIRRTSLSWRGGDCLNQLITLNSLTPWLWMRWIHSLQMNPVPIWNPALNEEHILPIYELASLIDSSKCNEIQKVIDIQAIELNQTPLEMYFSGASTRSILYSGPLSCSVIRNIPYYTRTLATLGTLKRARVGFPEDSLCILGSFDNFSKVRIQDIAENDKILVCRDPWWVHFDKAGKVSNDEFGELHKFYTYLSITHEQGNVVLGFNQRILMIFPDKPPKLIPSEHIRLGDMLCYIDIVMRKTLKSKVIGVGIVQAKGNFSLQKGRFSMVAVNQVVTGEDEAACFPGNASVVLRGGERVRMDELKVGDYVLSIHPTTSKPVYSKVYLWAHRDPHTTATFLHITHPHGHLHISANHLILSGDQRRPVPADQLRVGDTIHFISFCLQQQQQFDGKEKIIISIPVLHIDTCTQKGYYAPFTNNGMIVVNGIAASVYSHLSTRSQSYRGNNLSNVTNGLIQQFGMHKVGHIVLSPVRLGYTLDIGRVLSQQRDMKTHMNKYCQLLLNTFY